MENKDAKFFSYDLLKILGIGAAWYIVIFEGFSKFFINFGIAPLDTIATMLGGLVLPIVPTFFVARYIHNNKGKDFLTSWVVGVVLLCLISTIGMLNGKNHWW